MEAATDKKKRGRPTVDERNGLGMVEVIARGDTENLSHRQHVNRFYETAGANLVSQHLDAIPHADKVIEPYRDIYVPRRTGKAVLEQLGRMLEQDGYSEEAATKIAAKATEALQQGLSVKFVSRWIRNGRLTGHFDPVEAASEIRFTDQEAVDAYVYLDFLRDVLQEAQKKGAATVAGHCVDYPKAIEITETLRDKFLSQYLNAR